MNRIVLIGNGFDIAHGLKTSYANFIDWYWEQRVKSFVGNYTNISEDPLCTFKTKDPHDVWNVFAFNLPRFIHKIPGKDVVQSIISDSSRFDVGFTIFFNKIIKSIESKGWGEISNSGIKANRNMFVIHAARDSMHPKIKDGDLCVLKVYGFENAGSQEGKIVLTKCQNKTLNMAVISQ